MPQHFAAPPPVRTFSPFFQREGGWEIRNPKSKIRHMQVHFLFTRAFGPVIIVQHLMTGGAGVVDLAV
jgi:hypothetical protein